MAIKLEKNKCYMLAEKGHEEKLIFLLEIKYHRAIDGKHIITLDYSEVYGYIETSVDFEDIEYLFEIPIDENIKNRLVGKWGKDIAESRGVI